jgi:hypothetical protein
MPMLVDGVSGVSGGFTIGSFTYGVTVILWITNPSTLLPGSDEANSLAT